MENNINESGILHLPLLPMKGLVLFPKMILSFDVVREKSVFALNFAMKKDQLVFVVTQKEIKEDNPNFDSLNKIGVIARVKNILYQPAKVMRVTIEGLRRASLREFESETPFILSEVEVCKENKQRESLHEMALMNMTKDIFDQYISLVADVQSDLIIDIDNKKDAGEFADIISCNFVKDYTQKQLLLTELIVSKRLEILINYLLKELDIICLKSEMTEKFKHNVEDENRKYYLRQQLKLIQDELGDSFNLKSDANEIKEKILKIKTSEKSRNKLLKECDRFARMPFESQETGMIKNYLDVCVELPWNKKTKDHIDLNKAQQILDKDHYGLKKVKERIIEMLAVRKLSDEIKGQIICLVGPPGVGKTSIVKSIAESIGRKYARISLGGVRDESEIRGHRKTYIGAMPGRIISAIKQAGSSNPLVLLDEIDKLSKDAFGDPTSALLEVLDPEQNNTFYDHYIDLPFDLSDVLFITTANDFDKIPNPLLDRMDVIKIEGYTNEEKFNIAKKHLVPKQLKKHGLNLNLTKIDEKALRSIIEYYTREAGVRELERKIASLFRKAAKEIVSEKEEKVIFNDSNLEKFLGPKKFRHDKLNDHDEIGITKGLAWTAAGGETLQIEVIILKGNGKIHLTGSLGKVMKESAEIAISYVRNNCERFGIDTKFYKNSDVHVHVPEGSIPKDGPSAGVTLATSIVSALAKVPVRHDIAMTGEITLRGKVLPIGGLKEKSMAAYVMGIRNVIIPKENKSDLEEIEDSIKPKMNFILADCIDVALNNALINFKC